MLSQKIHIFNKCLFFVLFKKINHNTFISSNASDAQAFEGFYCLEKLSHSITFVHIIITFVINKAIPDALNDELINLLLNQ